MVITGRSEDGIIFPWYTNFCVYHRDEQGKPGSYPMSVQAVLEEYLEIEYKHAITVSIKWFEDKPFNTVRFELPDDEATMFFLRWS